MVLALGRIEEPTVRPRQTEARCPDEMTAAHPVLVWITYGQFFDVAREIVLHPEVDLLILAPVGTLEHFERLVVCRLRLAVGKLNRLSTSLKNASYHAVSHHISTKYTAFRHH